MHQVIGLATVGRVYYFSVGGTEQRARWTDSITAQSSQIVAMNAYYTSVKGVEAAPLVVTPLDVEPELETSDPSLSFMHNSSRWRCGKRRILNCRQPSRHSLLRPLADYLHSIRMLLAGSDPQPHPCAAVEKALQMSFSVTAAVTENSETNATLVQFLDAVCMLRSCSLSLCSECEQLAFLLNLYHLMLQHAYLVLGPPASAVQWLTLYNLTADDVISLAELEHCILRAGMSAPTNLSLKFSTPKSTFACALTRRDWRINFALNSGSVSIPPGVPIYLPDKIHSQLDRVAESFLSSSVQVELLSNRSGVVVVLPKVRPVPQKQTPGP
ncbi:MAG: hypothetical protein SGPRY_012566 [Prymnesium sp.]